MVKSKLGCRTCRHRKIKCDEGFPTCQQCRKTARQCDGPFRLKFVFVGPRELQETSTQRRRKTPLPQQCSVLPFSDPSEARTFQYFLSKVAPDLGGDLDADFWTALLPKISHGDRAIRDALLAISHLYEQSSYTFEQASTQERKTVAMSRWYVRSLSDFSSRLATLQCRKDYLLALLSCLLFTNIEFQQNNVLNACNLLKCGFSLISSSCQKEERAFDISDSTTKTMMQMLARQRVLLAAFGRPAPQDAFKVFSETRSIDLSPMDYFKEARERLYECLNDSVLLLRAARAAEADQLESQDRHMLYRNQEAVSRKLELWLHNFVQHWTTDQTGLMTTEKSSPRIMIINCEIALVWVYTCLQPEIALDQHIDRFEHILNIADEVIRQRHEKGISSVKFTPELGVIAPLFLTGWKCRDRDLRRRALSLLYRGPEQEALYSAELHAKAVKAVIDIEERHTADSSSHESIREGWLPPEAARVRNLTIHYETWDGVKVQPALVYQQTRPSEDAKPILVEKTILL